MNIVSGILLQGFRKMGLPMFRTGELPAVLKHAIIFQKKQNRINFMWKKCLLIFLGFAGICHADDLAGYTRMDKKEQNQTHIELSDPGFEKGGRGWKLFPCATIEKGTGRSATYALKYERKKASDYQIITTEVNARPGAFYRFGAWIKTENVTVSPQGGGATVALEFSQWGQNGKKIYLTGRYLRGIFGTNDWTFVSDVVRIPKNAAGVKLTLYIWKGATGKAWFDDVTIQEQGMNLWSLYTLNPYNTVTDGRCSIAVSYDGKSVQERGLAARLSIPAASFVQRAPVRKNRAEFQLGKMAPGRYKAEFLLLNPKKKTVLYSTEIPLRIAVDAKPAVAIDRFGRTLVDGKPFLPIGFLTGGLEAGIMDKLKEAGMNCALPYSSMKLARSPKVPRSPEEIVKVLDLAAKKGIKVIFSCKDVGSTARFGLHEWFGTKGQDAIIERVTGLLKNHPALLAWYINDEQPSSQIPRLKTMREQFNRLDPNHPVYGALYQYEDLPLYGPTCDVIGVDPYPLAGDTMDKAVFALTQTRLSGLPLWVVPQACNTAIYRDEKKVSAPNPSEEKIRSLVLLETAYGAKGFLFYKFEDLMSWKLPKGNFAKEWPKFKRVTAMLRELEPYILSEHPVERLSEGKVVAARLRNAEGKSVILIVGVGPEEASAELKLETGKFRSRYGRAAEKDGKWIFQGKGICSDLLFEK